MPTPGGGSFLRLLTAVPTLLSTILPTSALLTAGFDELCTVVHTRAPTAIAPTTPRMTTTWRRQSLDGSDGGCGGAPVSGSTSPDTSVGRPPYLIASTYRRLLGKRSAGSQNVVGAPSVRRPVQ